MAREDSAGGVGTSAERLRHIIGGAFLCIVAEGVLASLLFAWTDRGATPADIVRRFTDTQHSAGDVCVLVAVKALLVVVGGISAAILGRVPSAMPSDTCDDGHDHANGNGARAGACNGAVAAAGPDGVVVQPLLMPGAQAADSAPAPQRGDLSSGFESKKRANARRQGLVAVIFLVSTAFQMYIGIKTIRFDFQDAPHQAPLLGVLVLLTNASTWLIVRAVREATKEDGYHVPEFHPHPLYYREDVPFRKCDLCNERGSTFYSCRQCGFDVCPRCFTKKDKRTSEGLLRSDSGYKEPPEFSTWQYVVRTGRLVTPHVPLFLLAILCLVATTLAQLFLPNYQGKILDAITQNDHETFKDAILVYLVLSVATGLLNAVRSLCFNVAMRQIGMSLRKSLFGQIVAQDMVFFDSMKTGDLISRLSGNIGSMLSPLQSTLQTLLSNSILLVGSLAWCFVISWRLSMLAFTTLAPIIYMTSAYARWSRRQNYMIWQTLGDANADAAEVITNMRLVRAFSSEEAEKAKYGEKCDISLRKGMQDALYGTLTVTLGDYLDQGASVIILWCGGATAMQAGSALTVGRLITYTLYYNKIQNSYNALNGVLNSFTKSAGAAMRVLSLFDLHPDIPSTDPTAGANLPGGPREAVSVRFENVDFHYQLRPERPVLRAFSLDVPAGSVTALVGKSGAGKSTVAALLLRFYDVRGGRILAGGTDVRHLSVQSLHRAMGVVTQDTQLFNASIEENIAYGIESYTQEQLVQAAQRAQAHEFIVGLPDGYRTRVGERGTRLSGGQKQRLAICRALLREPRLLLLDEATSSLDASSEAEVQASLDALIWTGEHTVILIAHRLSTVVNANQIALVENGSVAEKGTHNELIAANGKYAELVAHQIQQQRKPSQNDDSHARYTSRGTGIVVHRRDIITGPTFFAAWSRREAAQRAGLSGEGKARGGRGHNDLPGPRPRGP
eukprot:CAMPEP_0185163200 /NCGR_PEP_ID=MMETSP1139-20130426/7652_1 /TAXON_ID=298111 /ORGANISM="Pavlova sp., Strain CCMP459" /LENGTH=956 /DNA_ID=CAMNT_0027728549 /DNA_START=43 /DNA_END=2914 /DNA_ORIENTATION=-